MGYYIRVLGKTNPTITVGKLNDALRSENLNASIEVVDGSPDDWTQLLIKDKDDRDLVLIEKNEVIDGELGQEEIEEFKEEVIGCKPDSASKWLLKYFDKIKVIYAFQILNAVDNDEGWNIVGELKNTIWHETTGIFQADYEGFSNEQGYQILWQFNDNVAGTWCMALENSTDNFVNFKMDLGDKRQREEFFDGKVPQGAEII
jgi:hypothetical protein